MRAPARDRGFSLIEAMVASIVMLIGLLGLAGLQIVGMRANNLGKRMAQASLLAQDLVDQMQIWAYTDSRLSSTDSTLYSDTNNSTISQYWSLTNALAPTGTSGTVNFMYCDAPTNTGMGAYCGSNYNKLATNYEGVMSPVDTDLPAGEQTIFTRYWNVWNVDIANAGSAQGKLVQIVVRWHEPNLGYRSVTTSFFKYDPTQFNQ